jgi:hypothetical protein
MDSLDMSTVQGELVELQLELNAMTIAYRGAEGIERAALGEWIEVASAYRRALWDRLWELRQG